MTVRTATADKLDSAADQAEDAVTKAAEALRERAQDLALESGVRAESAADTVTASAQDAAAKLRAAADSLREGNLQDRTFGQITSGLADAAETVRDKDLGELGRDATSFARRNPVLFAGGVALLGFAAAHMLAKSGDK